MNYVFSRDFPISSTKEQKQKAQNLKQLQKQEEMFRFLLAASPHVVYSRDFMLYWNRLRQLEETQAVKDYLAYIKVGK